MMEEEMFVFGLGLSRADVVMELYWIGHQHPLLQSLAAFGLRICRVNILEEIGHWGMGEICMKVGFFWSMVHIKAVVGLPLSMVNINAEIGLPCCTVHIKATVGLPCCMANIVKELGLLSVGIYLNKIGLGSWEVIQEGDYLTAGLDISVTIHGMMWGEVE